MRNNAAQPFESNEMHNEKTIENYSNHNIANFSFIANSVVLTKIEGVLYIMLIQGGYENNVQWELPSGKVTVSESCEEAVIRELFEQTEIDVSKHLAFPIRSYTNSDCWDVISTAHLLLLDSSLIIGKGKMPINLFALDFVFNDVFPISFEQRMMIQDAANLRGDTIREWNVSG